MENMDIYFNRLCRITSDLSKYIKTDFEPVQNVTIANGGEPRPFSENEMWGGKDKHYVFEFEAVVKDEWKGKRVALSVKTGREGQWDATNPQFLIYVSGVAKQGIDVHHTDVVLTDCAKGGEKFSVRLEAYSGMIDEKCILSASTYLYDKVAEQLYYDLKTPLDVAELLDEDDENRIAIMTALNEAANQIDWRAPGSEEFLASAQTASDWLRKEFYGKKHADAVVHCIGHTHIDVAWMWRLAQTREKAARSFSTVINLMKEYPEYRFMSSQPQLYEFVKEDKPEIYENIKKAVKDGRWEPEGAMWLEADCNLTSGESLVRQLIYGKRFFKNEFGVDNKILWLPDVFGYSAALPQILKKSGCFL